MKTAPPKIDPFKAIYDSIDDLKVEQAKYNNQFLESCKKLELSNQKIKKDLETKLTSYVENATFDPFKEEVLNF